MPNNYKLCPVCGLPPQSPSSPPPTPATAPPPPQPNPPSYNQNIPQAQNILKNEGTTLVLAIVLGLFGLCGVGHFYVGKIGRGVGILVGVLILYIIGGVTIVFYVGIIFLILAVVVFIWQIFDARKLCREYNNYLSKNGRPPW